MDIRGQIIGEPPSRRDYWKVSRDAKDNPVFYMVDKRSLWTVNAEKQVKRQIKEVIDGEVMITLTAILKRSKKPGDVIDAMIGILRNSCLSKEAIIKRVDYQVAYVSDDELPEILFTIKQQ